MSVISHKKYHYFIHQRLLASLFVSKQLLIFLYSWHFVTQVKLTIKTIKLHDTNLLTINALWFLLYGQYPGMLFDKVLAKYRKSFISFLLSFTKKKICYSLFKTVYFASARQLDFGGYVYKDIFFAEPQPNCKVSLYGIDLFYMVDFLYSQQSRSILKVKQRVSLKLECVFNNDINFSNTEYLRAINIPLIIEDEIKNTSQTVLNQNA
jgi:hypothetical protein